MKTITGILMQNEVATRRFLMLQRCFEMHTALWVNRMWLYFEYEEPRVNRDAEEFLA